MLGNADLLIHQGVAPTPTNFGISLCMPAGVLETYTDELKELL